MRFLRSGLGDGSRIEVPIDIGAATDAVAYELRCRGIHVFSDALALVKKDLDTFAPSVPVHPRRQRRAVRWGAAGLGKGLATFLHRQVEFRGRLRERLEG